MIVIRIVGGLASQLHKYAVLKSIAQQNNKEFKVDLSFYDYMDKKDFMYYGLPKLGFEPHVASYQEIVKAKEPTKTGKFIYFFNGLFSCVPYLNQFSIKVLNRLERMFLNTGFINKSYSSVHVSNSSSLDWIDSILEKENIYISAEFGLRFDLIENIRNDLKETIDNVVLKGNAKVYLNKINSSKIPLAMHIRRGDYVSNSKVNQFHGTCTKKYYINALEKYIKTDGLQVFVFSDDLDWVKEEFKDFLPKDTEFVSGNENFEDFILMSNCSNHIIANSGFSSLSAWLSGTEDSNITSPSRWFVDESTNLNQMSMLPKGWNYIESND